MPQTPLSDRIRQYFIHSNNKPASAQELVSALGTNRTYLDNCLKKMMTLNLIQRDTSNLRRGYKYSLVESNRLAISYEKEYRGYLREYVFRVLSLSKVSENMIYSYFAAVSNPKKNRRTVIDRLNNYIGAAAWNQAYDISHGDWITFHILLSLLNEEQTWTQLLAEINNDEFCNAAIFEGEKVIDKWKESSD